MDTTGDVDPGGAATHLGPWDVAGTLKVGASGNGTLNVEDGGVVSNSYGYIAYSSGSTGEVTIAGVGSEWNNVGVLNVGRSGSGTLNVEAGGVVSNTKDGYIGRYPHSIGEATVTGSDSHWNNSEDLWIGGTSTTDGGPGTLNLHDGGLVTVSNITKLRSTGTLNLDGGNLTTGSFDNSEAGTFNFYNGTLTVNGAGGAFDPGAGNFTLDGLSVDDVAQLVMANTASATLSGDLTVGSNRRGKFTIEAGGVVANTYGIIGDQSLSTGEATVTGPGSQWNNSNDLTVGYKGFGTLNVEAGGVVSNEKGYLGYYASFDGFDSSRGVATVTGPGSMWNNSGGLVVGGIGSATLNVLDGGVVSNTGGIIGNSLGSNGVATVSGTDSEWNNTGDLYVGDRGNGTLNIEGAGVVSNTRGYIGEWLGSNGEATISGIGSQWNNSSDLVVGGEGNGTLNLLNGGLVSNNKGYIGNYFGGTGTATISGADSQWNNSDALWIGNNMPAAGGAGTLNLNNSGLVTVSNTTKLRSTGTINLDGGSLTTGSFDNSELGTLNFSDGTLTVNAAGGVFNPGTSDFTIDGLAADDLSELVITNTASATLSGDLTVGSNRRGKFTIEAGGVVANTYGIIGDQSLSTGEATVSGSGSQWNNSSRLTVGNLGDGILKVEAGGLVNSNSGGYIGLFSISTGKVTVTGSGSQWNNSAALSVGNSGNGALNVEAGGMVSNTAGYIGYDGSSTGVVTVTGADSQWNNSGDLVVGGEGNGTLNIENEGLVAVAGTTSIGAMGTVNLTGGRFEFGQTSLVEFSSINAASGSLAGNLPHTDYTDVSTLTALQNNAVDLTEVTLTNSGVLYGDASMGNALINTSSGEVEVMPAERMRFGGSANTNTGEINNFGGVVRFDQDVTNQAGGFIGGRGQFVADGGWSNQGVMAFSAGTADILGDVVNDIGGQIVTSGGATTTIFDDLEHNGAEIRTSADSRTVLFGQASGTGDYTGTGTVYFEGDLRPGNSPGQVSFGGNVVLGTTSTTQIELGGLTAGAQHDQLEITGTANLDGTLDLLPLAPYTDPATRGTADDFTIITAAERSGTFSTVQYDGSTLAPDFETDGDGSFRDHVAGGLFRSVTYTSTAVRLQNLLASEGDTDGDLDVDTVDLTQMIMNYTGATGSGTTWLTGDTDGDGDTDTGDLTTAIINFTSARNSAAAVPEPSGLLLLLLAVGCLAATRGRSCRS